MSKIKIRDKVKVVNIYITFNSFHVKYNSTDNPFMREKMFMYKPHSIIGKSVDLVKHLVEEWLFDMENNAR